MVTAAELRLHRARRVPLSHRKLSSWYHQLSQQLEAGLPFAATLRGSRGTGAPPAALETMAGAIERGGSVDDALRSAGAWLPVADALALSAAAEAGRLPPTLKNLSARHAQLGAAKSRVVLACAYPLFVLHLGLLLLPLVRLIDWEKGFQWSATAYLRGVASGMLPLWILAAVVWAAARRFPAAAYRVVRWLPLAGSYARAQALADFAFGLASFLESGVPIGQSWAAVGLITRAPDLRRAAEEMEAVIAGGAAPGGRLAQWRCFPPEFVALYQTGESTGQLEANLHRLATLQQDAANRALTLATLVYPALVFLGVAAAVAYFVITLYAGYLRMLTQLAA